MRIRFMRPLSPRARSLFSPFTVIVLVFVLVSSQTIVTADQPVRRIKFKRGTTSSRVSGKLKSMSDKAVFVIRVRAGQRLVAESQSSHPTKVTLVSPSGQPGDEDMQGTHTEVDSTEAGDYRITVRENPKGDPWKGTFYLNVTVV